MCGLVAAYCCCLIFGHGCRLVGFVVFRNITRDCFGQGTVNRIGLVALHMCGLVAAHCCGLVRLIVFRDIARNGFGQFAADSVALVTRHVRGLVAAHCRRQVLADRIGHILGRRIRNVFSLIVDIPGLCRYIDIRCRLFYLC